MAKNKVSMVLTETDGETVKSSLAEVERMLPGLISLKPLERRSLTRMGQKSEPFARGTLRVLANHPQVVPPGLDLAEAQADMSARDALVPIQEQVRRLASRIDDTVAALGHDIMNVALEGYGLLKVSGASHGLDELRKDIGSRYSRSRKKPAGEEPAVGESSDSVD
jgi:hypothetical protein